MAATVPGSMRACRGLLAAAVPLLLLTLLLASDRCAASQSFGADTCASNEKLPCSTSTDQDATYRIQGIASNIAYADLPSQVRDSFALTGQAASYTCLSVAIEFANYYAPTCVIDIDNWSVSSPSSDSPQCSVDECQDTNCGTFENGPLALRLEITNLRWAAPLGDTITTFPLERFQFTRPSSYTSPWDDDDRTVIVNWGVNPCDDDCDNHTHDDDAYCGCTDQSGHTCDDDDTKSNNACPTLCDNNYLNTPCNDDSGVVRSCSGSTPYGQYRWTPRYTTDASEDISCGGSKLENVQARTACNSFAMCNHALNPTQSLGFRPADIVGLYEGSLSTGACPMFGTPCSFSDDDYILSPAWDNEDDEDNLSCNTHGGGETIFAADGLTCMVPASSFSATVNEPYPLTEALYRDLAFDGSSDVGFFSKTMVTGADYYTAAHCGHCANNNLIGTRFFHYDMSPTCTAHTFASSSNTAPLPAFSVELDASNSKGATVSGLTYTAGLTGLASQGTAVLPESGATTAALEILTDPATLEQSPPGSLLDLQNDALIECSISADHLGPSNGLYPYPATTCAGDRPCTPLDQTALSEEGDGRRSLWYILPIEDMFASGVAAQCNKVFSADTGVKIYSAFMSPKYSVDEGFTSGYNPNTETSSDGMRSCPYSQQADTTGGALLCRSANREVQTGDGTLSGYASSPAYVAASFDQWTTDHTQWILDGGVGSGLPEPLWTDYEAHHFMPDQYDPLPSPNIWLSLEAGAEAVFYVPTPNASPDDADLSTFETQLNVYFPSTFTGQLESVVEVDLSLFSSIASVSYNGESLPPQNLCPSLANQCDPAAPTFDLCSYTVFSIGISDSGGNTGFVTLELEIDGCEGFTLPPLCQATDSTCSTATQNTFTVSAVEATALTGALFFAIDPLAGIPGSPNCYTECTVQVYQHIGSGSSAQRFAVSARETIPPCSETNTIDATGTYGEEPDPNIAYICSQISQSPSSTPNPSTTATPSQTPSEGSSLSQTPSGTPTRTRAESASRSFTPTATPSPGIPSSTPSPSFGSDNSTGCDACEFSCFSSPIDWITSPCIFIPVIVLIVILISIIICVSVAISRRDKEKDE